MTRKKDRRKKRHQSAGARRNNLRNAKRAITREQVPRESAAALLPAKLAWHIVTVAPRRELTTARRLAGVEKAIEESAVYRSEDRTLAVYAPSDTFMVEYRGKARATPALCFPGYIFVGLTPGVSLFHRVSGVDGVTGAMGGWLDPRKIKDRDLGALEDWLTGTERKPVVPKFAVHVGKLVQITDGPFMGFQGVVDAHTPEGVVTLLVSIFGRETPTELTLDQLEAA